MVRHRTAFVHWNPYQPRKTLWTRKFYLAPRISSAHRGLGRSRVSKIRNGLDISSAQPFLSAFVVFLDVTSGTLCRNNIVAPWESTLASSVHQASHSISHRQFRISPHLTAAGCRGVRPQERECMDPRLEFLDRRHSHLVFKPVDGNLDEALC